MKTNNQDSNPKPEKAVSKGKTRVRRDRQEAQYERSDFKTRKKQLQDELQGYMYSQSSKLSSVSRNLIFGILGTIWVMTFSEGKMTIPNPYLFYALLASLLFMVVDVFHYFWDSISYHRQQYKLDSYMNHEEIENIYEKRMDKINNRSHYFLIGKTSVLLLAALFFIVGIAQFIPSICELICK